MVSAAGIGGGGVFVALLIFVGRYEAWDAVPLSKAMIFTGSIISFCLNIRKRHPLHGGPLIDFELCKMVVPMALAGTLLGVFFNGVLPQWCIVALLFVLLSLVTYRTLHTGLTTYQRETAAAREPAFQEISLVQIHGRSQEDLTSVAKLTDDEPTGRTQNGPLEEGGEGGPSAVTSETAESEREAAPTASRAPTESTREEEEMDGKKTESEGDAKTEADTSAGKEAAASSSSSTSSSSSFRPLPPRYSFGVGMNGSSSAHPQSEYTMSYASAGESGLEDENGTYQFAHISDVAAMSETLIQDQGRGIMGRLGGRWARGGITLPSIPLPGPVASLQAVHAPPSRFQMYQDISILLMVLLSVITCGAMLHHYKGHHRVIAGLFVVLGLLLCSVVEGGFALQLLAGLNTEWTKKRCGLFAGVSLVAGICSGLLGIGGGLIFSPFFVFMEIDAVVTVATAATCVIFTATSTTFQYLLINRIIITAALFFGTMTTLASYCGVRLVHYVSVRYGRKSYVILIVAAAVGASSVLTMIESVALFRGHGHFGGKG
ncbi:unnamed protein product [Vitrella brassicaformis CCMP3155]|uniref:Sulfite exporter TauE/SafE n=2 Tax=Vitrella brassicaformis TaxID=1169539 RepID=A0A0G4H1R1_VITBC|nr:unnamed protein product [Vitrella brassicaformis CCMP3155]|eukprot:CEM37440.1 unnamed protein product [Vitrella brassicaformis CCMP3155]